MSSQYFHRNWTRSRTSNELDVEENAIREEDQLILHKAYLLTKSVPRQSNRTKWREGAGFNPNLHLDQHARGGNQLQSGDIVFARGLEDELLFLVVKKTLKLNGKVKSVNVHKVF